MTHSEKSTPAYRDGYRAGYAGMPRRNPGGWKPARNSNLWFDGYDAGMEKSIAELEELDEPYPAPYGTGAARVRPTDGPDDRLPAQTETIDPQRKEAPQMKESSIKVILTRPGIERQMVEMFYNDIGVLFEDWGSIVEVVERDTAEEAGK